jgi:hypothetical protein
MDFLVENPSTRGFTCLSPQLPLQPNRLERAQWGQVFGDEVLATAILDRLLHHCDMISINGPSYRLKNRLAAIEQDTKVA